MRIHLIKEKTIRNFISQHPSGKSSFEDWLAKIKEADWSFPNDIKNTFITADLLGKSSFRIVFNIGGNKFRMICKYGFGETEIHLFICWIGTHAEYDKICNDGKQFTINVF
ncbi:MAG TPA: type II toxin-antitoxin system HigB family toxin [Hanamia sp.]